MSIFEGIGKIGDYTHLRSLQREMKYRIKTGASLRQAMGAQTQPSKTKQSDLQGTDDTRSANREGRIRQKLRQGQKLSAADKQYLKDNAPDLYEKATRIEERREALARALQRAKTKDEALRAVAQANIAVLAEMKAGGGDVPSFRGVGAGSSEGASAPVMTAGGAAAAGDALDMPPAETGAAVPAPSSGEMQGALGREALAQTGGDAPAAGAASQNAVQASGAAEEKEGFKPGPSTRDPYGNRRVLSREELDDMMRTAQRAGNLSPLDNEKVYLLRALQREWMEYANSEEYQNLPNTALDAADEETHGAVRRRKRQEQDGVSAAPPVPSAAEIFAAAHRYYHAAHDGERFIAKG